MKKKHLLTLLPLFLISLFLTACGSAVAAGSWPGITVDEARGVAYVAYNKNVYAVKIDNGVEAWRFPTEALGGFTTFAAPQLTPDDHLVVSGYDNIAYSLNADGGSQSWTFSGGSNRYIGSALSADGLVYVPNADHHLYALNSDGALQWSFSTGEPIWSQPATDGENIYVTGMDHQLYALDAQSGQEQWSLDLAGTMVGTPVLGENNMLYTGTLDHAVYAVNTQSHRQAWKFETQGWVWGHPLLSDGNLYVGDLNGFVYALDAATGKQLWQVDTGGAVTGSPALFNDSIYVINEAGKLISISLDGHSREITLPEAYQGPMYGTPVVVGDVMLIGLTANTSLLIAIDKDGAIVWNFTPAS